MSGQASDPLRAPRAAAADLIGDAAVEALKTFADTLVAAAGRAIDGLVTAETQEEIAAIRNQTVSAITNLGNTPFVGRH